MGATGSDHLGDGPLPGARGGFGSVRVEARIGDVSWTTSLFPQREGGYILPLKADIRRRAGIVAGDEVIVRLKLVARA